MKRAAVIDINIIGVIARGLSSVALSLVFASLILYSLLRYNQDTQIDLQRIKEKWSVIIPALSHSGFLIILALVISILLTLIFSALRYRFRYLAWLPHLFCSTIYLASAVPVAFASYYLIYAFKIQGISLIHPSTFSNSPTWIYYIIPSMILAVGDCFLAETFRHTEEEISASMRQYHLIMAKSRGETVWSDAIKEIVIRIFRIFSSRIVALFSGSVLVEFIFKLPGAGSLAFDAAEKRDIPILIGLLWSVVMVSVLLNFLYRLMVLIIDPRQR